MIRFENVSLAYGKAHAPALRDVSFNIDRGEFVFLVGASGSGKSTMLRLAIREDQVTEGTILVGGHDLSRLPNRKVPQLRRQIGSVFQDFRLLPNKTVEQNVAFALQVIGRPRRAIRALVPETLELVGLEGMGKRFPHELSGGEQQRVAIVRALANGPSVLLGDEPTGNLDPHTAEGVLTTLTDLVRRTRLAALIATHNYALAAKMDRVLVLDEGHLVEPPAAPVEQPELRRVTVGEPPGGAHLLGPRRGPEGGQRAGAIACARPRGGLAQGKVAGPEVEVAALGRLVLDGVGLELGQGTKRGHRQAPGQAPAVAGS